MNNFPKTPTINVSGAHKFQFAPFYTVLSLPEVFNKKIYDAVEFVPDSSWLLGYSTANELEFEETAKDSSNGPIYQWTISGFVPGDHPDLIVLMEEMEQSDHYVLITDNQNNCRFVGYDSPLIFLAKFQTGLKPGEARGYKYSFTGESASRAPVYYTV